LRGLTERNNIYSNRFMKIRIQGNSIRYRLKEPEVARFSKTGSVTESIQFGVMDGEQLCFVLQRSSVDELTVQHSHKTITIYVPLQIAQRWTDSDLVGFDAIISTGNGKSLNILVEKDFKCLDGSEEDNVGAYPNPAKQC
jgi:uncharacterized protein DUF7009